MKALIDEKENESREIKRIKKLADKKEAKEELRKYLVSSKAKEDGIKRGRKFFTAVDFEVSTAESMSNEGKFCP